MKDFFTGLCLLTLYPTYRWIKANFKFLVQCTILIFFFGVMIHECNGRADKENKQAQEEHKELVNWQNSPEFAFRFCITTVAGMNGTATPEQINACNKAAGR